MGDLIRLHRIVELPVRTLEDIAREHEGIDLYASLRDGIRPVRKSRFERVCDWLGDTFDSARGLAFFAGLLFPLCAAAFCIGYFGLHELLAVVL